MMSKDGGPAFPSLQPIYAMNMGLGPQPATGMSLRDWFAGQVLTTLVGYKPAHELCVQAKADTAPYMAQMAYEFADAMLAEREKSR